MGSLFRALVIHFWSLLTNCSLNFSLCVCASAVVEVLSECCLLSYMARVENRLSFLFRLVNIINVQTLTQARPQCRSPRPVCLDWVHDNYSSVFLLCFSGFSPRRTWVVLTPALWFWCWPGGEESSRFTWTPCGRRSTQRNILAASLTTSTTCCAFGSTTTSTRIKTAPAWRMWGYIRLRAARYDEIKTISRYGLAQLQNCTGCALIYLCYRFQNEACHLHCVVHDSVSVSERLGSFSEMLWAAQRIH